MATKSIYPSRCATVHLFNADFTPKLYSQVRISDAARLQVANRQLSGEAVWPQTELWYVTHKLLLAQPLWTFRFLDDMAITNTGTVVLHAVNILQDDELLGKISVEYARGGDYKLRLDGHRIATKAEESGRSRRRIKRCKHTADPDVALRIALAMFGAQTIDERIADAKTKADLCSARYRASADSELRTYSYKLFDKAGSFAEDHIEQYVKEKNLEDAHDKFTKARIAHTVSKVVVSTLDGDRGLLVLQHGDGEYVLVSNPSSSRRQIRQCRAQDLPPDVATRVGMLKMVSPETIIPLAGVRVSETAFLTYTGEQPELPAE